MATPVKASMPVLRCVLYLFLAFASAEEFDFIVVGGGVAGSIMASRLSESGKHSVLLLNVAGAPPRPYSGPVLLSDEFIVKHNRTSNEGLQVKISQPGYSSVPNFSVAETGSSPARWLGGSSLVGLSLYLRDHPETLDAWGEGWNWKVMQQYFHKVEQLAQDCYDGHKSCGDYGKAGPVHIAKEPSYTHTLTMDFIAAARSSGMHETRELNTNHGAGVGVPPTMQHDDGTKVNVFDAYLRPAMGRANLHIRDEARADRLIMKGHACKGVAFRDLRTGADEIVLARKEVIVSSGYVYTPRLLFLSGIGPKAELEKVGLQVAHELPAVGKHLTSARYSPLSWSTAKQTLSQMLGSPISEERFVAQPAAYQSTVQEALARFQSKQLSQAEPHATRSDVVLTFVPAFQALKSAPLQFSFQGEPWPLKTNAYTIFVTLGETEAKGTVTFPAGAPDVSPVVTHEPLTDADWELAKEAVAVAMDVGNRSALGGGFLSNGAGRRDAFSALYDGRGSCRMGKSKEDSVVDHELRVHGLSGLRIVDGSVIPRASPYLAMPEVMALAERAADLVRGEHQDNEAPKEDEKKETAKPYSIDVLKKTVGEHASLLDMIEYLAAADQGSSQVLLESSAAGNPLPAVVGLVPLALLMVAAGAWQGVFRAGKDGESNKESLEEPLSYQRFL